MATDPKTVGMLAGGAGGGVVSALALANDISIVIMQGAVGCAQPSEICDAGGRLVAAASLILISAAGALAGRLRTPAKPVPVPESKEVPHA